jgi:hypothetical protein
MTVLNNTLFAPSFDLSPARRILAFLGAAYKRWAEARRRAAQDAVFWALAQSDSRVMAEIQRALSAEIRHDPVMR